MPLPDVPKQPASTFSATFCSPVGVRILVRDDFKAQEVLNITYVYLFKVEPASIQLFDSVYFYLHTNSFQYQLIGRPNQTHMVTRSTRQDVQGDTLLQTFRSSKLCFQKQVPAAELCALHDRFISNFDMKTMIDNGQLCTFAMCLDCCITINAGVDDALEEFTFT